GTDLYDYCVSKGYFSDDHLDKMNLPDCVGFLPFYERSMLSCFTGLSKNIRQNIATLGSILVKIPFPFYILLLPSLLIPPNKYYVKLWQFVHSYYMKNKIYILKD
ncbi:unnamed protein product, partial [marine sediment metagenome]